MQAVQNEVKRTIAVAAGKGGVGKSTLTTLLAAALKRQDERVGVVDADLYGPSLRQMMPEEQMPKQENGKWFPALAQGMKLLSYAFFSSDSAMRAPIANQVLRQFLQNVVWGTLDWLLIDFPPGTGDIPITAAQLVPLNGCVIVTTPQKVAALDVEKTIDMFRKMKVPILGIVENMSYYKELSCTPFGTGGGAQLAEKQGIPFLGKIPLDPSISLSADNGTLADLHLPVMDPIIEQLKLSMKNTQNPIRSVMIIDQKHLKIEWENGTIASIDAEQLQKNCPCAGCRVTHSRSGAVLLLKVEAVGRYGLKFDFSSGCSCGIYPFELLKGLEARV